MTREPLEVIFDFAAEYKEARTSKAKDQVNEKVKDYLLKEQNESYGNYWSIYFIRRNRK